jgi:hypothetical protein
MAFTGEGKANAKFSDIHQISEVQKSPKCCQICFENYKIKVQNYKME